MGCMGRGRCLPAFLPGRALPGLHYLSQGLRGWRENPIVQPRHREILFIHFPFCPRLFVSGSQPVLSWEWGRVSPGRAGTGCAYSSEPCPLTCQPPHSCRRKGNRAMTRACWKGCSSAPAAVPSPTCTAKSRNVALGFMVAEGSGTGTRPRVWLA